MVSKVADITQNLAIFCDLPHASAVVSRLLAAGFYYGGQIPLYEVVEDYPDSDAENHGDWSIQTYPNVAVGHLYSGHYWLGDDEQVDDIIALIDWESLPMICDYIEVSQASVEHLKPKARLYAHREDIIVVARIGRVDDWAAYRGSDQLSLNWIADYGLKLSESEARTLFPVCADLKYRC